MVSLFWSTFTSSINGERWVMSYEIVKVGNFDLKGLTLCLVGPQPMSHVRAHTHTHTHTHTCIHTHQGSKQKDRSQILPEWHLPVSFSLLPYLLKCYLYCFSLSLPVLLKSHPSIITEKKCKVVPSFAEFLIQYGTQIWGESANAIWLLHQGQGQGTASWMEVPCLKLNQTAFLQWDGTGLMV